jgi:hypothetical protein
MISYVLLNSFLPTHPLRVEHHTLTYDPSFLKGWMPRTNILASMLTLDLMELKICFSKRSEGIEL